MRTLSPGGLASRLRANAATLFYVLVALGASAPAWIVRHPPLQDLPFHMATLRQVHNYADPAYGFARDYVLNLGSTQYAFYYVVGTVLAYVVGVPDASRLMMTLYLGGTVLAMRALLLALGKDPRLCLLVVPLLVNLLFLYGLLPFMCGIALMFGALALAVTYVEEPTPVRGASLALAALALFYTHVVPYALFGVTFLFLFPWSRPKQWIAAACPVAPSVLAVAWWVFLSPQGQKSSSALASALAHAPYREGLAKFAQWSIDVFRDSSDEWHFIALGLLVIAAIGLSQADPDVAKPSSRAMAVIPILSTILYFSTGDWLGDVWLVSQRFPVPALMGLIPLLRMPGGLRGACIAGFSIVLAASSTLNVCRHFIQFEREEVGNIQGAIDAMKPGKRVVGLMFDRASEILNDSPFVHYVSYYQVEKGGVVQFSNSGALYWPVRFRPGHYPPPGGKPYVGWEWYPDRVPIEEIYPYYDYVLSRGPGFSPPPGTFRLAWHEDPWFVYAREDP
ncbi:MAG: hypothetical protein ABTD50_20940 [Polyangiaceae bacterium]